MASGGVNRDIKRLSIKERAALAECGKRMYDVINQALCDFGPWQIKDSWLAFKLEDGSWDGNIYDSMKAARKFSDPYRCCYYSFRAALAGISARDCEIFLDFHRQAREALLPQADPDENKARVPIMSFGAGDIFRQAQRGELDG
jgi:hypothetical protein